MKILQKITLIFIGAALFAQIIPVTAAETAGTTGGPDGGIITSSANVISSGATDVALASLVATEMTAFATVCIPYTEGSSPGGIVSIPGPAGICGQISTLGQMISLLAVKETKKQGSDLTSKIKDLAWRMARIVLKKLILDRLVDATVAWIQRDGEGSIIGDWDAFLRRAGQEAVGELAQELGAGRLCAPFNLQLQILFSPPQKFSQQITCTLNDITQNVLGFVDDFTHGRWIAYNELWQPQNNFYGSTLISWDRAVEQTKRSEQAAQNEGIAGRGFLSFKNSDGDITTPGGLVADAATSVLHIPANTIINAQDIEQYITAIADAYLNQLTKKGIKWLQERSKKPSADTDVTAKNPCLRLNGDLRRACLDNEKAATDSFNQDRTLVRNQMDNTIQIRRFAGIVIQKSIQIQTSLVDDLQKLATCQKSPAGTDQQLQISQQLTNEQDALTFLEDKLTEQQDILDSLQSDGDSLNTITTRDWSLLSKNINDTGDIQTANNLLTSAETEQQIIQKNADQAKNQLQTCLNPTKTPVL